MSDSAARTPRPRPRKAAFKREVPAVDLVVNKDSTDFKAMTDAYATGERVSTKGMTREQVIKLITGQSIGRKSAPAIFGISDAAQEATASRRIRVRRDAVAALAGSRIERVAKEVVILRSKDGGMFVSNM